MVAGNRKQFVVVILGALAVGGVACADRSGVRSQGSAGPATGADARLDPGVAKPTGQDAGAAPTGPVVDDWGFAPADEEMDMARATGGAPPMAAAPTMRKASRIGLAAGGAKDAGNFRENLKAGYLPRPADLAYEGLFYDYSFDTGEAQPCKKLFCPSYVHAVAKDPFSGQPEHYLAVGLNSGIEEKDFARKRLNLVVVLDISGSMGAPFDRYYYDRFGNRQENKATDEGSESRRSKMQVATESIAALMDHLRPEDRFGIVLFDDRAYRAKPMSPVGATDMNKIREHVLALGPRGGTNMEAGIIEATALYGELAADPEVENRIVFLTDAMPNTGDTSESGLIGLARANAERRVYTTFIGIGVDFNTELVTAMTKVRGANYYSVHSAKEFKQRLADEFDFMVTPLVFGLRLTLEAKGWEIVKVYGSPEANEATGELMKVNTLFPSKVEAGETRGGVVLLQLRRTAAAGEGSLTLKTSYEDRGGKRDGDAARIAIDPADAEVFPNTGIRKAILLARYADVLITWMAEEGRALLAKRPPLVQIAINRRAGIPRPEVADVLGKWEQQSMPLRVSPAYREAFGSFRKYLVAEAKAIGDPKLDQETELLDRLAAWKESK